MSSIRVPSVLFAAAAFAGCTHYVMRGTVAAVEGPDSAQVCLGNHEVRVGDRVGLFKFICRGVPSPRTAYYDPRTGSYVPRAAGYTVCDKRLIGEGIVTQLLDEHMSIIRVDPGVSFQEGTIVEKR